MADKVICHLEDIENYGRRWESQKDLDGRYRPPPGMETMHVQGAAYLNPTPRTRISEITEVTKQLEGLNQTPPNGNIENEDYQGSIPLNSEQDALLATVLLNPVNEDAYAQLAALRAEAYANSQRQSPGLFPRTTKPDWSNKPAWRQATSPATGTAAQSSAKESDSSFLGACFLCRGVGHRSAQCPLVQCFICGEKGHLARQCPTRIIGTSDSCKNCDTPGYMFKTCPNCEESRKKLGNGKAGDSIR
ncbi:uncharacterized protein LOC106643290 [Copidosoma floridanum]|uniref:uncharacterized protein LOC106643290 n=1 Tax=Copidosoma floridanum TaxID=29053 RepID=UPI0006C9C5E3|nr:uncharacterized protein LOC106643290 [Copidosoma floridanum]